MTSSSSNVTLELLTGSVVVNIEEKRSGVETALCTTVPYEVLAHLLRRAGYKVEKSVQSSLSKR